MTNMSQTTEPEITSLNLESQPLEIEVDEMTTDEAWSYIDVVTGGATNGVCQGYCRVYEFAA